MLPVILKVEYRVDVIHHDNLQREQILNFSSLVPLYKKNKKIMPVKKYKNDYPQHSSIRMFLYMDIHRFEKSHINDQ